MDLSLIKLYGIFSQETAVTLGSGATRRKTTSKTYWFAKEMHGNKVELRSLDMDMRLQGQLLVLEREKFLEDFQPEAQTTYKYLSRPLMEGDAHREGGRHVHAVREYEKVRAIDESNIRAAFGMGISLLELGRRDKALTVFNGLLELDEAFQEEHKHLFNSLGISLRRQKLYEQTLRYYSKALEMSVMDENLHFNIARAHFEMGDKAQALWNINKALDINSFFEEALLFGKFLLENKLFSEDDPRMQQLRLSLRAAGMLS